MKKIPSLFVRNFSTRPVLATNEVTPGCGWVLAGEGLATEKVDGTSCLVKDGVLYKRQVRKPARKVRGTLGYSCMDFLPAPEGWVGCQDDPDTTTGHWPGWIPVGDGPEDKWHREAWRITPWLHEDDGTYELIGPKVQGNPYGLKLHILELHGSRRYLQQGLPNFPGLRDFLAATDIEGLVWHHEDGRRAKIKRSDFGIPWPVKELQEGRENSWGLM